MNGELHQRGHDAGHAEDEHRPGEKTRDMCLLAQVAQEQTGGKVAHLNGADQQAALSAANAEFFFNARNLRTRMTKNNNEDDEKKRNRIQKEMKAAGKI